MFNNWALPTEGGHAIQDGQNRSPERVEGMLPGEPLRPMDIVRRPNLSERSVKAAGPLTLQSAGDAAVRSTGGSGGPGGEAMVLDAASFNRRRSCLEPPQCLAQNRRRSMDNCAPPHGYGAKRCTETTSVASPPTQAASQSPLRRAHLPEASLAADQRSQRRSSIDLSAAFGARAEGDWSRSASERRASIDAVGISGRRGEAEWARSASERRAVESTPGVTQTLSPEARSPASAPTAAWEAPAPGALHSEQQGLDARSSSDPACAFTSPPGSRPQSPPPLPHRPQSPPLPHPLQREAVPRSRLGGGDREYKQCSSPGAAAACDPAAANVNEQYRRSDGVSVNVFSSGLYQSTGCTPPPGSSLTADDCMQQRCMDSSSPTTVLHKSGGSQSSSPGDVKAYAGDGSTASSQHSGSESDDDAGPDEVVREGSSAAEGKGLRCWVAKRLTRFMDRGREKSEPQGMHCSGSGSVGSESAIMRSGGSSAMSSRRMASVAAMRVSRSMDVQRQQPEAHGAAMPQPAAGAAQLFQRWTNSRGVLGSPGAVMPLPTSVEALMLQAPAPKPKSSLPGMFRLDKAVADTLLLQKTRRMIKERWQA